MRTKEKVNTIDGPWKKISVGVFLYSLEGIWRHLNCVSRICFKYITTSINNKVQVKKLRARFFARLRSSELRQLPRLTPPGPPCAAPATLQPVISGTLPARFFKPRVKPRTGAFRHPGERSPRARPEITVSPPRVCGRRHAEKRRVSVIQKRHQGQHDSCQPGAFSAA